MEGTSQQCLGLPQPLGEGKQTPPRLCAQTEMEPEGRAVQEGARLHLSRHGRQRRNRH